jgi:hypothetical protein
MAIPDARVGSPLYPNSNRHERIAWWSEDLAMPQCNERATFSKTISQVFEITGSNPEKVVILRCEPPSASLEG